jgi:hypothetical protein
MFILHHLTAPLYPPVKKGVISVNRTVIEEWRDWGEGDEEALTSLKR